MSDSTQPFDPKFTVNSATCIGCGACAADCVAEIIEMQGKTPVIQPENRENCIACQHCLAVCPVGAVSVLGNNPAASWPLTKVAYEQKGLETLIRGRRSVRHFTDEPVAPGMLERLLDGMGYAPTGVNDRRRIFSVIDNRATLVAFRDKALHKLAAAKAAGKVPEALLWIADMADSWFNEGKDEIFRNAPHMITVSTPKDNPIGMVDCIIALSYFDILAQGLGVGTVWAGLANILLTAIAPELQSDLGIPDDYQLGYCMLFGNPAVKYARTVQREPEAVQRVQL